MATAKTPTFDEKRPASQVEACQVCGAPLEGLDRFCSACGTPQETALPADGQQPVAQKHIRCENCGAEISLAVDRRSYVCPFCDSAYVVEFAPDDSGRQPPEFVIGFSITPEQALERYHAWVSQGGVFQPGDLKTARIEQKLQGVYLPFWSFSMLAQSNWSASIGEYWYRTETYTTVENGKTVTKTRTVRETEWWPLSGKHHCYYSGYLVSGSRGLSQPDAERIKPFNLAGLRRYEPFFLAGWLSEEYTVARDDALAVCQQEFRRREGENIGAFLPGDTYRGLESTTRFSHVNSDLILLPIYLLTYNYRGKRYRFLVNGQTGKTAGDKPISWLRVVLLVVGVLLAVLAAVALLAVLWQA